MAKGGEGYLDQKADGMDGRSNLKLSRGAGGEQNGIKDLESISDS